MPECSCGAFVSEAFARVFGDNEDKVYGCIRCENKRGIGARETTTGGETA